MRKLINLLINIKNKIIIKKIKTLNYHFYTITVIIFWLSVNNKNQKWSKYQTLKNKNKIWAKVPLPNIVTTVGEKNIEEITNKKF